MATSVPPSSPSQGHRPRKAEAERTEATCARSLLARQHVRKYMSHVVPATLGQCRPQRSLPAARKSRGMLTAPLGGGYAGVVLALGR